jgi:hypothetical protein
MGRLRACWVRLRGRVSEDELIAVRAVWDNVGLIVFKDLLKTAWHGMAWHSGGVEEP